METTVRIKTRSGTTTPWLEVDYPGLRPPLALFADLEMIGWKAPAIQPPPAAAIDWSTPNEATGERFTIRDYPVVGAMVTPPPGSGRDGAWTDAEDRAFRTVLIGVLTRHGVAPDELTVTAPEPAALTVTTAAADVPKKRRFGRSRDAAEAPPKAVAPAHVGPVLPLTRRVDGGVVLEATCDPLKKDRLIAAAESLGHPVEVRSVEARRIEHYRAAEYETVTPAVQAVVFVPVDLEPRATAVLADVGLLAPADVLATAAPPPNGVAREAAELALAPVTSLTDTRLGAEVTTARIVVTFDPNRRAHVLDTLGNHGIEIVAVDAAERMVTNSYRGTSYESAVPAVAVTVVVDPDDIARVSAILSGAAGVDPADASRFEVIPSVVEPAATEKAAEERRPFRVISAS